MNCKWQAILLNKVRSSFGEQQLDLRKLSQEVCKLYNLDGCHAATCPQENSMTPAPEQEAVAGGPQV